MTATRRALSVLAALLALSAPPAAAAPFAFSTGAPTNDIGMASGGAVETADDFELANRTTITEISITGLLPPGALLTDTQSVGLELYRVFPLGSVQPPSGHVPTRAGSPADVAFDARSGGGLLPWSAMQLTDSFTAMNSVATGIHPSPNNLTGGDGPVTGREVRYRLTPDTPIRLDPGRYFLVPQVTLTSGHFLWLSATTPVAPDSETWIRDAALAPDWLRVGTDIVGGHVYNAAFSLVGRSCTAITIGPAALPHATAGTPYTTTLAVSGGQEPYTFSAQRLPDGLTLSADGTLAGTLATAGSFPLDLGVTDADGCTGSVTLALTVDAGTPNVTPPALSRLRVRPMSFAVATRRNGVRHGGTTIAYRDSAAATTTFTVLRRVRRHGRTRFVVVGRFHHADVAGANRVRFGGRLHGAALAPGRYSLRARPRLGSVAGAAVVVGFRVLP